MLGNVFSSMQLKSLKVLGECLWARPMKRGEVPSVLVPQGKTLSFSPCNLAGVLMGHIHSRKRETRTMIGTVIPNIENNSRICN